MKNLLNKLLQYSLVMMILFSILMANGTIDGKEKGNETNKDNQPLMQNINLITAKLVCKSNCEVRIGTAFKFEYVLKPEMLNVPVLVTNKHVIEGAIEGTIYMKEYYNDEKRKPVMSIEISLKDFEKKWISHPHKDVDLSIMPLDYVLKEMDEERKILAYECIKEQHLLTSKEQGQLNVVEPILMVGYPAGLIDNFSNFPIITYGITATHPRLLFKFREEFLIDAGCYKGSSGSPVLLSNLCNCNEENRKTKLLGIVYRQYYQEAEGQIIDNNLNRNPIKYRTEIPMNLCRVIRASKLLDFKAKLRELIDKQ